MLTKKYRVFKEVWGLENLTQFSQLRHPVLVWHCCEQGCHVSIEKREPRLNINLSLSETSRLTWYQYLSFPNQTLWSSTPSSLSSKSLKKMRQKFLSERRVCSCAWLIWFRWEMARMFSRISIRFCFLRVWIPTWNNEHNSSNNCGLRKTIKQCR